MGRNGRDMRVPMAGNDRCLWYKAIYINNNQLVHDAEAMGIFYCEEIETKEISVDIYGNDLETQTTLIKIKTNDFIDDLKTNDYVLFKNELYRVAGISSKPYEKTNKFAINPPNTSTIQLKR